MDEQPELWLTLPQMAERLQICTKTLKKYVREYQIPCIAFGRSLRFDPVKVTKHLEKAFTAPTDKFINKRIKSKIRPEAKNPESERYKRLPGLS